MTLQLRKPGSRLHVGVSRPWTDGTMGLKRLRLGEVIWGTPSGQGMAN